MYMSTYGVEICTMRHECINMCIVFLIYSTVWAIYFAGSILHV